MSVLVRVVLEIVVLKLRVAPLEFSNLKLLYKVPILGMCASASPQLWVNT